MQKNGIKNAKKSTIKNQLGINFRDLNFIFQKQTEWAKKSLKI